jgi:histone H3/H4
MEKILEALVDEITTRVIAKLEANAEGAYNFLKLKVKAENVEGLEDMIREFAEEIAETAAKDAIDNASISVEASISS